MQRYRYIDVICGIMIVWMILGHIASACNLKESWFYITGNHLLPFFMPWFFYKSGMLYKHKNAYEMLVGGRLSENSDLMAWGGYL